MAHQQRDLINKDEADRLKIPVHGPPSSVASAGLPSPLALPPPAVATACSPSSSAAAGVTVSPRTASTSPFIHLPDPAPVDLSPLPAPTVIPSSSQAPSRCTTCRKRVGLAGFRCRCDGLYCGVHRYSDRHACTFDYKAQAREAIARENPVYKAPKLLRI